MEPKVFIAVIVSAAFQAGWNFYTKSFQGDRGLLLVVGWGFTGIVLMPAGMLLAGPGAITRPAIFYAAASGLIHTTYVLLLGRAYGKGDLSVVFPVSRGGGIALTCAFALILGVEQVSLLGLIGILFVIAGIALVGLGKMDRLPTSGDGIGAALLVSLAIASYSLVDKIGTSHAPLLFYLGAMNLTPALILMPWYCRRRRSETLVILQTHKMRALLVASAGSAAYLIILWAFRHSPASYVVALREISIIFAMLLGVFVLKERLTRKKIAAIPAILTGIILIKFA